MLTNDGYKKKKCFLQDDKLIIDDESYQIRNIKEIPWTSLWPVFIFFALATIFTLFCFLTLPGSLLLHDAIHNHSMVTRIGLKILIMILVIGFPAIWVFFIHLLIFKRKLRNSGWKINGYHCLWVEKDDPPETEALLRQLTRILPESQLKITPKKSTVILLLISPVIIAIGLCLKTSPIIQIIIILSGLSLAIIVFTLHQNDLRKKMTWKK